MSNGAQHYRAAEQLLKLSAQVLPSGLAIYGKGEKLTLIAMAQAHAELAHTAALMYEHVMHLRELDPTDKTLSDWASAIQKEK